MRCNCCNRKLEDKEIVWNPEIQAWDMCGVCLDVAFDAAYSSGFNKYNDPLDDDCFIVDEEYDDDVLYAGSLSSLIGAGYNEEEGYE
jgi:hypothetical protein